MMPQYSDFDCATPEIVINSSVREKLYGSDICAQIIYFNRPSTKKKRKQTKLAKHLEYVMIYYLINRSQGLKDIRCILYAAVR